jgi:membrane protease YdiL (CAAX protease family)
MPRLFCSAGDTEKDMIKSLLHLNELHMQWKPITIVVLSTLLIITSWYRPMIPVQNLDHLVLFFLIPILTIVLIFHENPTAYGFQFGNWKAGLAFTGLGWIITLILAMVANQVQEFRAYYSAQAQPLFQLILTNGLDLFGWEFLFRGFLLFALLPVCGPYAIIIQAIPFAIAHIGKPELETLSCIFGGSLFGFVAWRTRSFLYPFLIHWFLTTAAVLIAAVMH